MQHWSIVATRAIARKESMPRFGPTVYITYDESTGEHRIGETARGMRSRNIGGRGWSASEKVIADIPAPSSKRERLAVETALIQHYLSLGLPLKNRKIR